MKEVLRIIPNLIVGALLLSNELNLHAQGTAFTYQGRLDNNGAVANGAYDLQFAIFNDPAGGSQIGSALTTNAVAVSNGLFTVTLDFGAAFDGNARWLEIAVRPGASAGDYTNLAPRQPITSTPYAIRALSAKSVGTTDNQPLELTVNGQRGLRLDPTALTETVNVIGGSARNFVGAGVVGATIGGGGSGNYFGHFSTNRVEADFGTVSGGLQNTIESFALFATIAGLSPAGLAALWAASRDAENVELKQRLETLEQLMNQKNGGAK